jgi:hypothetical protein
LGYDCSQEGCPHDCNGNGACRDGACVCSKGFSGVACAEADATTLLHHQRRHHAAVAAAASPGLGAVLASAATRPQPVSLVESDRLARLAAAQHPLVEAPTAAAAAARDPMVNLRQGASPQPVPRRYLPVPSGSNDAAALHDAARTLAVRCATRCAAGCAHASCPQGGSRTACHSSCVLECVPECLETEK